MAESSKDPIQIARDLFDLVKNYAKQETIEPLKGLGRYIGFGLAGSFLIFLSALFGILGILRLLQTEIDTFDGNWSFVPYLIVLIVLCVSLFFTARAITREGK